MNASVTIQRTFIILLGALICSMLVYSYQVNGIVLLIGLPLALLLIHQLFQHPRRCLNFALIAGFFAIGITRYLGDVPTGLSVDFALLLAILAALFHTGLQTDFKQLNNPLIWLTLIWMGYCVFEIFNPEARSFEAWFYAVRGVALYQLFIIPLTFLYASTPKDLDRFLKIIIGISLLGALWGYRQFLFGLDDAENRWLMAGAYKTHLLFGKLRYFSFFSDAGQWGAGSAQMGVITAILALGPFQKKYKYLFGLFSLLFFHQMALSGTRGALFVPITGFMMYFIVSRNIKTILLGSLLLGSVFVFLKYTTIANNNDQIRRMRSAFNGEDASLNVRKENQKKFAAYLATRPFGGGIGTSGTWGIRFSPGTFLAQTANDSWYVKIWAETGIVGLTLHISCILLISAFSVFKIWKVKDPKLRQKLMALFCGFFGVAVASYGNPIFGQIPQGPIIYMTWVYLFLAPKLDEQITTQNNTV
ncbi:MAG: O-antigen ligase family protein [Lacibacter sp.]